MMRSGTIVDATIIQAPSSTKNRHKERDPEMHQAKKGNQWHFGMTSPPQAGAGRHVSGGPSAAKDAAQPHKTHIGVDADSGLVHTLVGTAARVADVTQAHALLHGEESDVFGDVGYQGVDKREENKDRPVHWHVAMKPSKRRALGTDERSRLLERYERLKARIRAKVEHPFHVVKNLFRHRKTRYLGLAKNTAQLYTLFALANLVLARRHLMAMQG